MAQTESRIRLIFDGVEKGVVAAAAKASAAVKGLDDKNSKLSKSADKAGAALGVMGKGMLALGAANGAINVVGGVAGALTQLAPAALLLPGALLAGGAAMATFKIATAGVGDALKAGLSGDMKKFAKDTKDMAPAMLDAVKAVTAFKPQIDDLKHAVQSRFWDGFNTGIKQLGDNYLPILQRRLPDIAAQFNLVGRGIFEAFNSRDVMSDFDGLLKNTANALKGMGPAVGNVGAGFIKLGELGSRRLEGLGEAVDIVAGKFRDWVSKGVENGSIDRMIDNALKGFTDLGKTVGHIGSIIGSVFTGLGGQISSPLAKIEQLTGKVAEFLKSVQGQDALRALGDVLQTVGEQVGRVLDAGLDEIGPTLVALAPPAKEIAKTLGDLLVNAIRTLGPLIRGVADTFSAFPGSAGAAATAIAGVWAAVKVIKVANTVTEFLGLGDSIFKLGSKADGAGGKVEGFGKKLGGLKGIGAGLALGVAVEAMDKINAASEQGNLTGWNGELHDIQRIMTGDWGDPFADISKQLDDVGAKWRAGQAPVQQWALSVDQAAANAGISIQNFFRGLVGLPPLPPLKLDIDPATGEAKVDEFVGGVSRRTATAGLDANPGAANTALGGWVGHAIATVGTAHLSAEPGQANATVGGWVGGVSRTRGTAHLDAEPGGANATTSGWKGTADRTTGQAHLSAEDSMASRVAQGFYNSWAGRVITMSIHAITSIFGATGGAVTGGVIVPGFAPGGPVRGPGSGTSDNVPALLSNGEWVMTAEQVRKAGGFGGMQAIASALQNSGPSPVVAPARAALRPVPAPAGPSSGGVEVRFAGNTSDALATVIMSMVRTGKIQLKAA